MTAGCESNLLFFGAPATRRYQAELRQEKGARPRPERDKSDGEAHPQIEDNCVRAWIYDSIKMYK